MIELSEPDYQPLETFRLSWRWTAPRRGKAPMDVPANIRPLTHAKATEIYDLLAQRRHREDEGFLPVPFRLVDEINTSNTDASSVQDWLGELISDLEQGVIISWWPDLAVVTTADIFRRFWDAFCYPA